MKNLDERKQKTKVEDDAKISNSRLVFVFDDCVLFNRPAPSYIRAAGLPVQGKVLIHVQNPNLGPIRLV